MIGINQLHNSGIEVIGDKNAIAQKEKTIVVIGVARGGTSLIAGTLHHLGVFMGENATSPVFEDTHLAFAIEKSPEDLPTIIDKYNGSNPVWGFKRPSTIECLDFLHDKLRNPIYLFVFKDIFAISSRNAISMKTELISGLRRAHNDYNKVLNFIGCQEINGYLFSYEKVMQNKEMFVDCLVHIIDETKVSDMQKQSALNFIKPNPQDYLDVSRITKGTGRIDKVNKNTVSGWARYTSDERVATVDLYINDNKIASTLADQFRRDLLDMGVHSSGKCGYTFQLDKPINQEDVVRVKVSDDTVFLPLSSNRIK